MTSFTLHACWDWINVMTSFSMSLYCVSWYSSCADHPTTGMSRLLSHELQPAEAKVNIGIPQWLMWHTAAPQERGSAPVIKHQFLHEKGLRTELLCETRLVPCSAESFTVDSVISLCHLCFNSVNVSLRPLPTANQKPHNLDCFFLVWSAVLVLWLHWGLATCYTTVSIYLSPASSVCKEKSCFPKFF